MERGPYQGYFPEPAKSLFVLDTPGQEEAAMREFEVEGLALNFVSGSRYMGGYLGPQGEFATCVKPQVEAWAHGVKVLGKISRQHPQSAYAGLGVSLQLKWQYLKKTVPGVGHSYPLYLGGSIATSDFGKS